MTNKVLLCKGTIIFDDVNQVIGVIWPNEHNSCKTYNVSLVRSRKTIEIEDYYSAIEIIRNGVEE